MRIDLNENEIAIMSQSLSDLSFKENLIKNLKGFKFQEISWDILKSEMENDQDLLDSMVIWLINLIGLDEEQFQEILTNKLMVQDQAIQKLIDQQYQRIKMIFIDFFFDQLPFNYLIKISKKQGKYNLKESIRENIVEQLNIEIQKLYTFDSTISIIQDQLPETKRKERMKILTSKLVNNYEKIIIENRFLIGLIKEIQLDKLQNLIDIYLDNKKVFNNLY